MYYIAHAKEEGMGAPTPVSEIAGKPWLKDDEKRLMNLWEKYRGKPDGLQRLAAKFGRTPRAVQFHANQLGLYRKADGKAYLDLQDVCRIFNRTQNAVSQIFGSDGKYQRHCIPVDELWAWMEHPAHWHYYDVATLPDLAWREHFGDLRRGWLSTPEVCQEYGISRETVGRWRKEGRVRSIGSHNRRWHCKADIEREYKRYQTWLADHPGCKE